MARRQQPPQEPSVHSLVHLLPRSARARTHPVPETLSPFAKIDQARPAPSDHSVPMYNPPSALQASSHCLGWPCFQWGAEQVLPSQPSHQLPSEKNQSDSHGFSSNHERTLVFGFVSAAQKPLALVWLITAQVQTRARPPCARRSRPAAGRRHTGRSGRQEVFWGAIHPRNTSCTRRGSTGRCRVPAFPPSQQNGRKATKTNQNKTF